MKHCGLFFGSFNPIHVGHLIIAQYMLEHAGMDEIRFVVSPHNPFKDAKELFPEEHRLEMVRLAVADNNDLIVSDVEFNLPKPSYTIQTLLALTQQEPETRFSVIMGSDNLIGFSQWNDSEKILELCTLHVYHRYGYDYKGEYHPRIINYDAPVLQISATYIRELMQRNRSLKYLVPESIISYIEQHIKN